jgi:phospholipase C
MTAFGRARARRTALVGLVLAATLAALGASGGSASEQATPAQRLQQIKHIVVIYEENHSFDNVWGGWEGVNGLDKADAAHTTQVDQNGTPYACLRQNDVNLTSPPLSVTCTDSAHGFSSDFKNTWFSISKLIAPTDATCPPPLQAFSFPNGVLKGLGRPGGCTRDIVHAFYQEQYQLNGGRQNRYMVGSDAIGTVMGTYDTKSLPLYEWLHGKRHPSYVIDDAFFQSAFGGSFLNHQYLIAARAPEDPNAPASLHSLVDPAGFPRNTYPLYAPVAGATYRDSPFTVACPSPVAGLACGNWAVNTMQPSFEPFGTFGAKLVAQTHATIGDRLTAKNVDWAWYSGGWSNASGAVGKPGWTNGNGPACSDPNHDPAFTYPKCPDAVFQYHHQPFVYFAGYAPGTAGRAHLKDEQELLDTLAASKKAGNCQLPAVSFVKPLGEENEHPGYASVEQGGIHLVHLLQYITGIACKADTMVVVTYDEFGGQWDHVPPPGQAGGPSGPHDQFGPGTRIPALVIAPHLPGTFSVDSSEHDTLSILATIEHRFGLDPLTDRDKAVSDLSSAWSARVVSK